MSIFEIAAPETTLYVNGTHIEANELSEAIQRHNQNVDSLEAAQRRHRDGLGDLVTELTVTANAKKLRTAANTRADELLDIVRTERDLWKDRVRLLELVRTELAEATTAADRDLERARSKAEEQLAAAGLTEKSMPSYVNDPSIAGLQYARQHVDRTGPVRELLTLVEDLQRCANDVPLQIRLSREAAGAVDQQIRRHVEIALGVRNKGGL